MAIFRCKRSGNTVQFTNENDIAGLRKHEGYEEVIEPVPSQNLQEEALPGTPSVEVKPRKEKMKQDKKALGGFI